MGVTLSTSNAVAEIVLDRADKLNAFDASMVREMHEALDSISDARAVIVRAEGRAFCAGRDLATADPGNEDGEAVLNEQFNPLLLKIYELPVPTFAAVQGAALGVGLGIALACDVVYVADNAKVGSPFAQIGAVLDSGAHLHFVGRLGSHRALELVYTGRLLSGGDAAAIGLVNEAMPGDILLDTVRRIAATVAAGPTFAFMQSKTIVHAVVAGRRDPADVMRLEAAAQGRASRTTDYAEGMTAFLEKRSPDFSGG
ncbi:MAG: enoyl-CoA hydratase/isomerase family protein [Actinobacteria bacterium]|nr:enoyl-CoA hydratase/isomerase family protein [Actinomycetota bacterium]